MGFVKIFQIGLFKIRKYFLAFELNKTLFKRYNSNYRLLIINKTVVDIRLNFVIFGTLWVYTKQIIEAFEN